MTKEVLVTISGLQFAGEEENEPVEVITAGAYYKRNGKHYVVYDEVMEGFSQTTKNIIKLGENTMDITKSGAANVHMMFEKGRKNVSYYYTPYGDILVGIDATRVEIKETEENIDVKVEYNLEVNYEHMADCTISMKITPRGAKGFHIKNEG
jgi:uncharacterized beta-barrel protein YwiB (DUF1934 family)